MHHPKADRQFAADLEALECADTCVLVLPCCRSAHTEAGWMPGAGKRVIAYIPEMVEPELKLRHSLWHLGFRYRVNDKRLPGSPDIVLPKYRTVIFIHGCFWHGHRDCKFYTVPKTNTEFWTAKVARNQERDQEVWRQLETKGWAVVIVWECQLKKGR